METRARLRDLKVGVAFRFEGHNEGELSCLCFKGTEDNDYYKIMPNGFICYRNIAGRYVVPVGYYAEYNRRVGLPVAE